MVEVRNKQWFTPALCEVLSSHNAAFCLSDLKYLPHPAEVLERLDVATTDFSYVRLIGDRGRIDSLTKVFDREVVDLWGMVSSCRPSEDGMGEILGLPVSKRTSPPSTGASETTLL